MFMNIVHWDSSWEYSKRLGELLRKAEKGGSVRKLCFWQDGWACFRTKDKADDILLGLSEQCPGKVIEHEWAAKDECGSSLWQDGRSSRSIPSRDSQDWNSITQSVGARVQEWEAHTYFQEKLDSFWNGCMLKWRGLTSEQLREQSEEVGTAMLCYHWLSQLPWHKTWAACVNRQEDPLRAVQSAVDKMEQGQSM